MQKKFGHIVVLLFLPLIVLFQFGQTNFVHYHITEDGNLISHSHPYQLPSGEDGASNPGHNHSNSELIFYGSLDGAFNEAPSLLVLEAIYTNEIVNDNLRIDFLIDTSRHSAGLFFRGPPMA